MSDAVMDLFAAFPVEAKKQAIKVDTTVDTSVAVKTPQNKSETVIKDDSQIIGTQIYESEPGRLWLSYGHTKSLGGYESAKISIGLNIPIGAEMTGDFAKKIEGTKEAGMKLIEKMLGQELAALDEWVKSKREQEGKGLPF